MNASDIPESVRAEMDGAGCEPQTFNSWMKEKTPAQQTEMFGERAARRWRDGDATLVQLLKQTGNALSVDKFTA